MTKDVQAKNPSDTDSPTSSQLWRQRLNKSKEQQRVNHSDTKNAVRKTTSGNATSNVPSNSNRKARKGLRPG